MVEKENNYGGFITSISVGPASTHGFYISNIKSETFLKILGHPFQPVILIVFSAKK